MADFDFEYESGLLSEKQVIFIRGVLIKNGFDGGKVIIESFGKAGDNFSSNVKRVTVEQSDGSTHSIVAKIAPNVESIRTAMSADVSFGNKCFMYDKILPKYRLLEEDASIPEENRLKFPRCYGVLHEKLHEIILLEDVNQRDFVTLDRFKALTDEEVRIILKELAKLHSLAFVLKDKDPVTFTEFASGLVDFVTTLQNANTGFPTMEDDIILLFDDERYKNTIRGAVRYITDEGHKLSKADKGSKYSVFTHGNSWTNNVLFQLEDGKPLHYILIDYQFSDERSPASDLLYLIFSSTDYKSRSAHYNDWIDYYHGQLEQNLSHFNLKASYVYSKEKLLADLKRYARFFLGWSIIFTKVLSMNTEDAESFIEALGTRDQLEQVLDNIKTENIEADTQNFIKTKVQGILDSYYELGYSL